jgi:hypothetical protein
MTGDQKAAVVDAGTQATFTAINSILVSQGKSPLASGVTDVVGATVKTVVEGMKTIGATVGPITAATEPSTTTAIVGSTEPAATEPSPTAAPVG